MTLLETPEEQTGAGLSALAIATLAESFHIHRDTWTDDVVLCAIAKPDSTTGREVFITISNHPPVEWTSHARRKRP